MRASLFYLLEGLGAAANLTSLLLAIRRRPLKWPLGMLGIATFGYLFYQSRLMADLLLQVALMGLSVYGWQQWQQPETARPVSRLSNRQRAGLAGGVVVGTAVAGLLLRRWTPTLTPFADALVSVLGVAGLALLARKVIDAWPVLLLTDACYLALFAHKGYWPAFGLYWGYGVVAAVAWRRWRREAGGGVAVSGTE